MTIIQLFDEETTEEHMEFIKISKFELKYVDENGEEKSISTSDLKDYYSIRLTGIND